MEQNMKSGLILGRLAILNKNLGPIMSNFRVQFFYVFMGKKACGLELYLTKWIIPKVKPIII